MKTITICASASHFKQCDEIGAKLEKMGYKVRLPATVSKMRRQDDYEVGKYKTWLETGKGIEKKSELIRLHFREIELSDAVLVVNLEKHGVRGYVGGNTLMEMGVAFYLNKPIFLYRQWSMAQPNWEEIAGVAPVVIDEKLNEIVWADRR